MGEPHYVVLPTKAANLNVDDAHLRLPLDGVLVGADGPFLLGYGLLTGVSSLNGVFCRNG